MGKSNREIYIEEARGYGQSISRRGYDLRGYQKMGNNDKKQGEGDARVVGMEEEDKRMVIPDEDGEGDGGGGRWNGCG
ncbi:hypothetical protein V6N11_019731 [Hibiscus sabdariffa]|uniref:Uncharacterized protein n=1 Tax=Hibiscus sabdariffa TaxID=183260 RepID=A0ABR2NLR5_9ROSI